MRRVTRHLPKERDRHGRSAAAICRRRRARSMLQRIMSAPASSATLTTTATIKQTATATKDKQQTRSPLLGSQAHGGRCCRYGCPSSHLVPCGRDATKRKTSGGKRKGVALQRFKRLPANNQEQTVRKMRRVMMRCCCCKRKHLLPRLALPTAAASTASRVQQRHTIPNKKKNLLTHFQ